MLTDHCYFAKILGSPSGSKGRAKGCHLKHMTHPNLDPNQKPWQRDMAVWNGYQAAATEYHRSESWEPARSSHLAELRGMGPAPVVACSADDPFEFPLYWNTAWSSAPAYNSTANIQTTVSTKEGTTTCYIAISSNFNVFPKSSSSAPEQFDLNFTPYHLAAASGPVKNGTLK